MTRRVTANCLVWLLWPCVFAPAALGREPIPDKLVVLTFDDSSIGQFRYLEDGTIDPDSAMGILLDFAEAHPDFPPVAITTFITCRPATNFTPSCENGFKCSQPPVSGTVIGPVRFTPLNSR